MPLLDRNPIDVTLAGLQPALFRSAINALLDSPSYDALVIIVGSSGLAQPDLVADAVRGLPAAQRQAGAGLRQPARAGHRPAAEPARRPGLRRAGELRHRAGGDVAAPARRCRAAAPADGRAQAAPVAAADLPSGPLNEAESKALFARFGVPSPARSRRARRRGRAGGRARLGGRVVLKSCRATIAHKTRRRRRRGQRGAGRCRRRLRERWTAAVKRRHAGHRKASWCRRWSGRRRADPRLPPRPQLGTAILLGMGGVTAELFKDTAIRLLPLGRAGCRGDDATS